MQPAHAAATSYVFDDPAEWEESIGRHIVPLEVRGAERVGFHAELACEDVGYIKVCEVSSSAHRVVRSPALAARAELDWYKMTMLLGGRQEVRQGQHRALLDPGQWTFYDTTRPYEIDTAAGSHFLVMQLSARHLLQWKPESSIARTFDAHHGSGRIAANLIQLALQERSNLSEQARLDTAASVLGLLALNVMEQQGERPEGLDGVRHARLQEIKQYILDNLHSPDLTLASVAAAFRLSRRYLYKLFELDKQAPADFILAARLECSRKLLESPACRNMAVAQIAWRCGMPDPARFSHAFRRSFGVSPSEYRKQRMLMAGD